MLKSPGDKTTLNNQTPLYKSGLIGNYINYLSSHSVAVDIDDLLHCCDLGRQDINDEGHFLSQAQVNACHRCLDERLDDPEISYRVGQHALEMKSTGTVLQYGLQFITPGAMYKALDRIYPRWSRGHVSKTTIISKNRAHIAVSTRPGVREEPFQCDNRRGLFEAISTVHTGRPAKVSHPVCMHRGDNACEYRVTWEERPSAVWHRVGAYAAVASTLIAAIALFMAPPLVWALLVAGMTVGCLLIALVGTRKDNRELIGFLKSQGDAAGKLLKENETRSQNSRLIQEIGQAGVDIMAVDSFLDSVLASMSRNLDFSRAMILLYDDGGRRLGYAAGYGFTPSEQRYLEQLELAFDLLNSADPFIQALRSETPIFMNNVLANKAAMAPDSVRVMEKLRVEALAGIPLVYKKEPLGLLFVDTKDVKRDYTTSDINLLMGIASQLATGIVNARSYERLQESEERYRLLADNVADVIWILDIDSLRMKYVSPSVQHLHGYTPEEVMADTIDRFMTPESYERVVTVVAETTQQAAAGQIDPQRFATTLELDLLNKHGSITPAEVTAGLLLDSSGAPTAVLGISRDLSDRKKTERERAAMQNRLQQAHKMESLGTMAGSIAHNFNNLLMVVLGNLELAQEDLKATTVAAGSIQRAINASKRAADLSNLMLTYVGQLKKESLPVDLSRLVRDELEKLDESKMPQISLELDLADPMPLVVADAGQMRQMVSGFITNAVEALGEDQGRIRIATGAMFCDATYLATTYLKEDMPEGMYAYVEVSDTGSGMDPETLGKVFDPFFSTKFTGRGLGLAAVMGIIRSHYGAVKVSSQKGRGSTFTALFPIQGLSLAQDSAVPVDRPLDVEAETVLLVDDEAMVVEVGSQFLDRLGYRVLTASSGQEALDIITQDTDPIDCLLLDFTMPGMDGLETVQRIKKIRPGLKIIVTSGYTRQQIEDRFAVVVHPDDFIHKPFDMKVLKAKLQRVLSPHDADG